MSTSRWGTGSIFSATMMAASLAGCGAAGRGGAPGGGVAVTVVGKAELVAPFVMQAPTVSWSRPLASLIGDTRARNTACKSRTTQAPIASFRLVEPIADLALVVDQGGGYTQFVVVGPEQVWEQCNGNSIAAPAITWTTGEYHVYPTGGSEPFTVTLTSPTLAVAPRPAELPTLTAPTSGVASLELVSRGSHHFQLIVATEAPLEVQLRVLVDGVERPMRFEQCEVDPAGPCEHVPGVSGAPITTLPATRRIRISPWQSGSLPKGKVVVQAIADRRAVPWYQLIVGEPAADAPLEQRDLKNFGVSALRWRPSWSNVASGFMNVPAGFILYATREVRAESGGQPRTIAAGEPLLRLESMFVRANGEVVALRVDGPARDVLPTLIGTTRPATIVMPPPPPPDTRSDVSMYHYPYGDDASEFAGIEDARVAAFLKARDPVKACIGRELDKRGSGFGYDIATYNRDGTVKKVESLTKHIEDEVYRVCKVSRLDAMRAKLQTALRAEALVNLKAALEAR